MKIQGITEDALAERSSTTTLSAIPAGTYQATVFDAKLEEVRSGPNEGKPRLNVQFRVSDGEFENRRVFSYIPLYVAGDFWKTKAFFGSLGYDMKAGDFEVPDATELAGKPVAVRVKVGKDMNGEDRNEVGGFDAPSAEDVLASSLGATSSDLWAE